MIVVKIWFEVYILSELNETCAFSAPKVELCPCHTQIHAQEVGLQ